MNPATLQDLIISLKTDRARAGRSQEFTMRLGDSYFKAAEQLLRLHEFCLPKGVYEFWFAGLLIQRDLRLRTYKVV